MPKNRIILNVKDPSKYICRGCDWDVWKYENAYCYELITPPLTHESINKIVLDDLNRFFNIQANIEKRMQKCFVLVQANKNLIPFSKGEKKEVNIYEEGLKNYHLYNAPVSSLVSRLDELYSMPVLDETNLDENVTMDLPANFTNVNVLRKILAGFGFGLLEVEREIEMFVIIENGFNIQVTNDDNK